MTVVADIEKSLVVLLLAINVLPPPTNSHLMTSNKLEDRFYMPSETTQRIFQG